MARSETLKLWHIIRLKLLVGELIMHETAVVFARISNCHSVYELGKVRKCLISPVVARVSRDKRSVSTSTSGICIV